MNRADWMLLLPEIVLCGGGVLVMMLEAISPALRRAFMALSLLTTAVAAWAVYWVTPGHTVTGDAATFHGLLETSPTTAAFSWVILLATALCLLASQGYLRRERILSGEYHALLLWCATGLLLMLRATELLTVFLSLELLSLALYSLAAYHRRLAISGEAAIKYFLMGAFVSAFVLYGIALVYGATGTTHFAEIGPALAGQPDVPVLAILGFLMLIAGFGFKMSLVPFHAWSPDTYQGAPSPFVAFLSVAPKVASALVRLTPRSDPLVAPAELRAFRAFVTACFTRRRKQLRNVVIAATGRPAPTVLAGLAQLALDPAARPETLTPEQFVRLWRW